MKFTKRMASSISAKDYIKFTDFYGTHIGEVVSKETYDKEVSITILVLHSTCKPRKVLKVENKEYDFALDYPAVMQGQLYYHNFRKTTRIETNW